MAFSWTKYCIILQVALVMRTATVEASNLRWVSACCGRVPAYPVAGGEDYPGEVLYVARVKLLSGYTPGKMDVSSRVAHTSWGGKEHFSSSYQILTNPGWKSHLEWKKSSGYTVPANAVIGGYDKGRPLYVARFLYSDGHMIPGKALYQYGHAYVGYGGVEYEKREWYVLVEHKKTIGKRELASPSEYPNLRNVQPLKRAPIINQ